MKKITLLFFTVLLLSFTMQSQIVFQEDFSGLTINQPLDGQNGWSHDTSMGGTGSSIGGGPFSPVVDFGLSFPDYGTSPNSLFADNTVETDGCGHLFPSTISSGTFYVSFVINVSSAPSSAGTVRDVMRIMSGESFFTTLRIWVEESGGSGFNFGIKTGDPSNAGAVTPDNYTYNTDHLVVLKYTINPASNDDELELFVDPDFMAGEPGTSTLTAPLPMFEASDSVDRLAFPWNTTPAARFAGHIGLVSVARTWENLNLSTEEFSVTNIEANYISNSKLITFNATVSGEMNLYALDGKRILHVKLNNTDRMELANLDTGLYLTEVILQNGKTKNFKFVVD